MQLLSVIIVQTKVCWKECTISQEIKLHIGQKKVGNTDWRFCINCTAVISFTMKYNIIKLNNEIPPSLRSYGCTLTPFPPMLGQLGCSCFLLHVHIQCILSWIVSLKINRLQLYYHGIKLKDKRWLTCNLSFMLIPPSAQILPLHKNTFPATHIMTIFLTKSTHQLTSLGF